LNDPAPRKRASFGADSHSSSNNLDYLLEDEDHPKRGGAGKFFLILLALALALGFGYLRWKNQALPWLHLSPSKPAPDASAQSANDLSSTSAPSASQPANNQPASAPPDGSAAPPANASSSDAGAAAPDNAAKSTPESAKSDETPANKSADEPAAPAAATKPTPAPKPKRTPTDRASKPQAGVASAASADTVAEAQKYIYGRGVTQDCDRGMRLLKPAAAQANPKAMIEMGALYSAGLCTPHDLPTAYRWFAMALRKEPDNQAVQSDLQKLWGEMTQPERQLAIKLSQ
jgi:hypothetical protein